MNVWRIVVAGGSSCFILQGSEVKVVAFYVSGRLWEVQLVVFCVSGRHWEV